VAQQPLNRDDIPRVERPAGWVPRWAKSDVVGSRAKLLEFEARFKALDPPGDSVARQVDQQLVGSMIARGVCPPATQVCPHMCRGETGPVRGAGVRARNKARKTNGDGGPRCRDRAQEAWAYFAIRA